MGDLADIKEVTAETKDAEAMEQDLADDTRSLQKNPNAESGDFWNEIENALVTAVLIYGVADLRAFARRKNAELKGDPTLVQKALNLPITRTEMIKVFDANVKELRKVADVDLYVAAIEAIAKKVGDQSDYKEKTNVHEPTFQLQKEDPVSLVVFDDTSNTHISHLVYAISVDKQRKQIKLAFRGSVAVADWVADGDTFIVNHLNPLKSRPKNSIPQSKHVGIHRGFRQYMFGAPQKSKSKYETILEHLDTLFEQYPDYSLRISGHSLGAALATLFTFQCGAEDKVPGRITSVVFASPHVGDSRFFNAFQELRASGKVRNLRVTNHKDIIPTMPKTMCVVSMLHHGKPRFYRHVGVELMLFRDGDYRVNHPTSTTHRSRMRSGADDLGHAIKSASCGRLCCLLDICIGDVVKLHSCSEYMDRLDRINPNLKQLSFETSLYSDHERASLLCQLCNKC